ncbi:hypothetical protein, partial [Escherichia coli]|uniref:hypothetical protein n=1 Tax=Escherichia coli TaxID=562 RepID=UPI001BAEA7E8
KKKKKKKKKKRKLSIVNITVKDTKNHENGNVRIEYSSDGNERLIIQIVNVRKKKNICEAT